MKTLAIDFDGTICNNKFPEIGDPRQEVIDALLKWKRAGNEVILWTCREGKLLDDALQWCKQHGLVFDAVNENTKNLKEYYGNDPRKVGAYWYVDDRAITPMDFALFMETAPILPSEKQSGITRGNITRRTPHG